MVLASILTSLLCFPGSLSPPDEHPPVKPKEILSSLLSRSKSLSSLSLEGTAKYQDPLFKTLRQYTLRIQIKFFADGKCYARIDHRGDDKRTEETHIVKDDKWDVLNYHDKTVTRHQLTGNYVRADLNEISDMWFAIHPLLASNSDYFEKEYKSSIPQDDKDYTWVRFEPNEQSFRGASVAQIGVIKYQNRVSPANFPLQIMWRDPGGCETTWSFTKVSINEESSVPDSDFTIELREYERNGWKTQRSDGIAMWQRLKKTIGKE